MATVLALLVYGGFLVWLAVHRTWLFCLLLLPVFSMSTRLASVAYLDLSGPTQSAQLFREIGPGWATLPLALAHIAYLVPFLIVFRPSVAERLVAVTLEARSERQELISRFARRAVFAAFVVFTIALFVDMARIGVIPLLTGMERFEYTELYGGAYHRFLMDYGILLAFVLGLFFTVRALREGRTDVHFLVLLLVLYVYLVLAGHRFSAFYSHGTAFLMPVAVLILQRLHLSPAGEPGNRRRSFVFAANVGLVVFVAALVLFAIYNSYFFTRDRGTNDPATELYQRVLVQPGELWYGSWERVFQQGSNQPGEAFQAVFVRTVIDPQRNSTIPYLMVTEVGDRAFNMLNLGLAYGGGYPEIIFELCGRWLAYPALFALGLVTAGAYYLVVRAIVYQRLIRVALGWYVLFALVLIPLGGMLNFLVNWKFWLKVAALVGWIATEYAYTRFRSVAAPP